MPILTAIKRDSYLGKSVILEMSKIAVGYKQSLSFIACFVNFVTKVVA